MLGSSFVLLALLPVFTLSAPSHQVHSPFKSQLRHGHQHGHYPRTSISNVALRSPHDTTINTGDPSDLSHPSTPGNISNLASRESLSQRDLVDTLIPPSTSTTPSLSNPAAGTAIKLPLVMTYYPDWASDVMSPEQVDYSKFDVVDFAFALPNANYGLDWDTTGAPGLLARVVKAAHAAGKKAKLSIGGWTGSGHFSTAVSTAANRQIFVNNILQTYKQYDLDGIDIDWEYPGQQGEGSNAVSPADSQDMLQFLQLLRQALPPLALITAAVQTEVLAGPDGKPLTNVSDFAKVLNWVLIMNYDTYETASPPGPNAPLYDSCKSSRQPKANAVAAYNAWTNAGFPADQLVLGLPSYGYVISSSATALRERSESQPVRSLHQLSRRFAATPADDSGQIQFRSLVSENILTRNADGSFAVNPSSGFTRQWDACSATPFLTSASAAQTIPYDDPQSLAIKAKWVKDMGMGGVNLFDVHGDTSQWDLVNTVRTAMGVV